MRRIYSYIIPVMRVLAAVAVAVAVVSCRSETPEIPAAPDDEEGSLYLSFTIATRMQDKNTRADISYDQEGTAAENFINLDDITYLFFDGEGRYLYNVTPLTSTLAKDGSGYAVYEVTAKLYDSYFTNNIGSTIDLYILVLANYSDWGISIPTAERGVTTLQEFFESNDLLPTLQDWQPSTYQLLKADQADAWQRFPMAGLQKVSLDGTLLAQSSKADPYSLPADKNINMLRALAKIEIIDKINIPDGDVWNETDDNTGAMGTLRIHKAELLGVVDRGSLLPGYDRWININGEETQQVSQPSVPESANYIRSLLFDKENTSGVIPLGSNIEFEVDNAARQAREDKCPVFSAYVFEYSKLLEPDPGYQPYVRLTTRGGTGEGAGGKTESYESAVFLMRLAEYTEGTPDKNIGALLRNHIYRFEIGGIAQAIEVKWTVCDMNAASSDITFN